MTIKNIGIIIGGATSQDTVNIDHAEDIGSVLAQDYQVEYYNVSKTDDIARLMTDKLEGRLDIVFNNAAGKKGGDGTVEGILEILDIPYVGSDTLATAVAFDKKTTKAVVSSAGVPIIKGIAVSLEEYKLNPSVIVQNITTSLGYPVVVKASQGSDSIGISLVKHARKLIPALVRAFKEDSNVLVEEFIQRKAEVTCMVIGNGAKAHALEPVERVYQTELLYAQDISSRTYRIPELDQSILEEIKRHSVVAHQALGCSDYSRSDFLVDQSGCVQFLELNGHAGLGRGGPTEFTAKITKGWDYEGLIREILQVALARYK